MNGTAPAIHARLGGHPGQLDPGDGHVLTWRGDLTPTMLSDLLRAGSEGPVRMQDAAGTDKPVWIQRCWFDLARGRMVVQVLDRSMAA